MNWWLVLLVFKCSKFTCVVLLDLVLGHAVGALLGKKPWLCSFTPGSSALSGRSPSASISHLHKMKEDRMITVSLKPIKFFRVIFDFWYIYILLESWGGKPFGLPVYRKRKHFIVKTGFREALREFTRLPNYSKDFTSFRLCFMNYYMPRT